MLEAIEHVQEGVLQSSQYQVPWHMASCLTQMFDETPWWLTLNEHGEIQGSPMELT